LVPILIVVAGITMLVIVTVYVADETAEAIKRRRRSKVEDRCAELRDECLEYSSQPEWNRGTYGDRKECGPCYYECKAKGEWPHEKCPRPDSGPGDRWN
jgi:hypothetical protein